MKDQPTPAASEEAIWETRETLSELLSDARELQDVGQTALRTVLEAVGRSSGLLILSSSHKTKPPLIISQQLSSKWAEQIRNPDSPLMQWAQTVLDHEETVLPDRNEQALSKPKNLAATIPIAYKEGVLGVLLIQGRPLPKSNIEELMHLLPPISRAIRSRQALSDVLDRTSELARLQIDLTHLGFSTDLEILQARMLQGACKVLDGQTGAIILLDENNTEWMIRKTRGEEGDWAYLINARSGTGLVRACLESGELIHSADPTNDPRFDPSSDAIGDLRLQNMICAPMIVNRHVLGAIQIINKCSGSGFNTFDQHLISIIAALASNAMQATRLIQQLKVVNADLEASRWELLGSRNTLRALFDNLPTALYIIDPDFNILAINQGRAVVAGRSPKSLVGKPCYQALFQRSTSCPECRVRETFQEKIRTQRKESRLTGHDTSEWEINTYPISDEDGKVVSAILLEQDITEQQRLEGILAQSEKLAAIGQLAAGVAHEINNPLTAIVANAQILHRELPADSDLQESVDLISRAGARATQVVRNLLDFARKEDYHLRLTDINETLQRSLELIQHETLARSVKITFDPDPGLPAILVSQDHLQSVWLNLLLNAIDAIDKIPGKIRVTTQKVGDEIHVSVADNGKGIAPERLTRIFEPFYTTKEPGRGTGLGLSVCHRIVKQHGGHIRVESQVGIGSEFTVILPCS